jgi:hypothetical protein
VSAIQICARCSASWDVRGLPAQWCPKCFGALLDPVRTDQPLAPPEQRGFAWVARSAKRARRAPAQAADRPTPSYDRNPAWTLDDRRAAAPVGVSARRGRLVNLAAAAQQLLFAAAVAYGVAAIAELARYGVLLRNRNRLIHPALLLGSDVFVWVAQISAAALAIAAAVGCACQLIRLRRNACERAGVVDSRSSRSLLLGCLVPGVNLVMPGVFLMELAETERFRDIKAVNLIRVWWSVWIAEGALFAVGFAWRFQTGLQAKADGVVLAAITAAAAAATALLTREVLRRLEPSGSQTQTRWVLSAAPTEPRVPA